jgi:hypothetical protein
MVDEAAARALGTAALAEDVGAVLLGPSSTLHQGWYTAYDLVVLAVTNLEETVRAVLALGEHVVDVYYRNDRVYRVGRTLTEDEVRERLSGLPAVFTGTPTYRLDQLDAALRAGSFEYRLFESRPKS